MESESVGTEERPIGENSKLQRSQNMSIVANYYATEVFSRYTRNGKGERRKYGEILSAQFSSSGNSKSWIFGSLALEKKAETEFQMFFIVRTLRTPIFLTLPQNLEFQLTWNKPHGQGLNFQFGTIGKFLPIFYAIQRILIFSFPCKSTMS